jgi:hypothetical protein
MTKTPIYAKQDEIKERGDCGQECRFAEDNERADESVRGGADDCRGA